MWKTPNAMNHNSSDKYLSSRQKRYSSHVPNEVPQSRYVVNNNGLYNGTSSYQHALLVPQMLDYNYEFPAVLYQGMVPMNYNIPVSNENTPLAANQQHQNYYGHNMYMHSLVPDANNFKKHSQRASTGSGSSLSSQGSTFSNLHLAQSSIGTKNQLLDALPVEYPKPVKPRIRRLYWEEEKTTCYQVEALGVLVSRREDSDFLNGTKLLNVAGMTRGKRDGVLKSEKIKIVVKTGSMNLKGVWIPYERALEIARNEGVEDLLFPLFVKDIKNFYRERGGSLKNKAF